MAKPKPKVAVVEGHEEEVEKKPAPQMCEVCGNSYDKTFQIVMGNGGGQTTAHVFDSFECAIHALAPRCVHCGCMIVGHGVEADGQMYCCAHCARTLGRRELRDRAG